jgi:transcription factor IIIB 90 kDa subunit
VIETAPLVEIEPILHRYARRLEFGPATRQVASDAAAILARMNRDWMVTGRQPQALCGAALILAARMNNFRRTVREVVYVVRAGDGTILKRLEEFRRTKAGSLTVAQFREYGKRLRSDAEVPPSVWKAKEKELKAAIQAAEDAGIDVEASTPQDSVVLTDRDGFAIPGAPASSTNARRRGRSQRDNGALTPTSSSPTPGSSSIPIVINEADEAESDTHSVASSSTPSKKKRKPNAPPPVAISEADLAEEWTLEREIEHVVEVEVTDAAFELSLVRARSIATAEKERERKTRTTSSRSSTAGRSSLLKRKRSQVEPESRPTPDSEEAEEAEEVEEVELDPLDSASIHSDEFDEDPEVSNCLLSEPEIAVKEKIWVTNNEDWLRRQQERHYSKLLEQMKLNAIMSEEEQTAAREKRLKNKEARRQQNAELEARQSRASSAAEATAVMLEKRSSLGGARQRKIFSAVIDYDRLNSIYNTRTERPESTASESLADSRETSVLETTPVPVIPKVIKKPQVVEADEEIEVIVDVEGGALPDAVEEEYDEEEEGFQEEYDEEYEEEEDDVDYEGIGLEFEGEQEVDDDD